MRGQGHTVWVLVRKKSRTQPFEGQSHDGNLGHWAVPEEKCIWGRTWTPLLITFIFDRSASSQLPTGISFSLPPETPPSTCELLSLVRQGSGSHFLRQRAKPRETNGRLFLSFAALTAAGWPCFHPAWLHNCYLLCNGKSDFGQE